MRTITQQQKATIEEHLINGLDWNDDRLPCALCGSCRIVISEYYRGIFHHRIDVFTDFSSLLSSQLPHLTRSNSSCTCMICDIAGSRVGTNLDSSNASSDDLSSSQISSSGYPEYSDKNKMFSSRFVPEAMKVCGFCLTILKKGKVHILCTNTKRQKFERTFFTWHYSRSQCKVSI